MTGKPNQTVPKAPVKPIPVFEELFSLVFFDSVLPQIADMLLTISNQSCVLVVFSTSLFLQIFSSPVF